jgi:Protein of unknown function (DUF3039)
VPTPTRPTERCLIEDLSDDWDDSADLRSSRLGIASLDKAPYLLAHKIIRKAVGDFEDVTGDRQRESISGLTDPPFWKVKIDRWRGAVYVDSDGQPWLVAAGRRYEGEARDFYKRFMATVAQSKDSVLPTPEDRAHLKRQLAEERLLAREHRTQELALDLVRQARGGSDGIASGVLHTADESRAMAEVTVIYVPAEDDAPHEVLVELNVVEWAEFALIEWDEQVMLSAICSCESRWGSTYTSRRLHSIEIQTDDELDLICNGGMSAGQPGAMAPGHVAHVVHRKRLTEKTIDGDPVRAICGKWFVPRQDHEAVPECPTCQALQTLFRLQTSDEPDPSR